MRRRWWCPVDRENDPVGVTPPPVLARLVRPDQWMVGMALPVGGGVAVRGAVAAADVPTVHADPQVDPSVAGTEAVLATVAGGSHIRCESDMDARIVERDHTSDPTAPGPEPLRRTRMREGGHPGIHATLSSSTQVAYDGSVGRRGRFRGRRTPQLHQFAFHPDISVVSADGRARPRPNATVVDEMRPIGDVGDRWMVEGDEALDRELTLLDREQQKPDLTAARSRPSSWEDHEPVAPPASHAGGEPSPTRTATPARTRHPPSPPPEPDPKPGRARPHLPRTPTFGAFSRPKAPPTRHDGQLSTSEQQKTRLPADLRPGSGYFVSSSATFSLALACGGAGSRTPVR